MEGSNLCGPLQARHTTRHTACTMAAAKMEFSLFARRAQQYCRYAYIRNTDYEACIITPEEGGRSGRGREKRSMKIRNKPPRLQPVSTPGPDRDRAWSPPQTPRRVARSPQLGLPTRLAQRGRLRQTSNYVTLFWDIVKKYPDLWGLPKAGRPWDCGTRSLFNYFRVGILLFARNARGVQGLRASRRA